MSAPEAAHDRSGEDDRVPHDAPRHERSSEDDRVPADAPPAPSAADRAVATAQRFLARVSHVGRQDRYDGGAAERLVARVRRPADRAFLARRGHLATLARLGASVQAAAPVPRDDAPRVLVVALRSWTSHTAYESVLAQALRLRGANVTLLTCGGGMPLCEVGWSRRALPRPCDRCAWFTGEIAGASGLRHLRLGDRFDWGRDGTQAPLSPSGPQPRDGAAARKSAAWFARSPDITTAPDGAEALRDFTVTASGVGAATERVLDEVRPDIVLMVSGLFTAEHVLRECALARGIQVTTYEIAPRANALVFSHDAPAPLYDTRAAWEQLRDRPLTPPQKAAIEQLMGDRVRGVGAHEQYFAATESEEASIRSRLDIPPGGRIASLYSNITWDSAALDRDVGFASLVDWIEASIRAATGVADLTLVVRLHPGEQRWGSRDDIAAMMRERLGGLPANVRVVRPDEALDSYALLRMSDLVLTYATTVGLEAAVQGHRVAVAGDTHYRDRGFTIDVESADELARVLATPQGRLSDEEIDLAWRYAHLFFFRMQIPLPPVRAVSTHPTHVPGEAVDLEPGADAYLDWLCDAILHRRPLMLPDHLVG
jgi:hypothetical protein